MAVNNGSSRLTSGNADRNVFTKHGNAVDLASSRSSDSEQQLKEDAEYFSELLGYSAERLAREPELIASEQEYLVRQATDAVSHHRHALTQALDTARHLCDHFAHADAELEALLASLPALERAGREFEAASASDEEAQRGNRQLLSNHATLLDILEVPSLMLTCVRNRHYDEVLELRVFVRRLETLHRGLPLVERLSAEAGEALAAMRDSLLRSLEADVTLPDCLRAVGFLRRLGGFSERDLRLEFLARRDAWVAGADATRSEAAGHPDEGAEAPAYDVLKRATDGLRLHVADVAGQYLAVFAADADAAADVLPTWVLRRVAAYVSLLERHAPRLPDGPALAAVLEAAMYAGAGLARVGADVRPLLAPAFECAIRALFEAGLAGAEAACRRLAVQGAWAGVKRLADAGQPRGALNQLPPDSLLEYPPLAVYANGVVAALNELRHCAAAVVAGDLAARLRESLSRVLGIARDSGPPDAEAAVRTTLAPYLSLALARVFGAPLERLGLDAASFLATLRLDDRLDGEDVEGEAPSV